MNTCKLLACGRIIFYNSKNLASPDEFFSSHSVAEPGDFCASEAAVPLGSSHVAISDNPDFFSWIHPIAKQIRAKKGSKGITSHGRNLIRAGCHWLEEKFGKRNLTFLTTTLPDEALLQLTPASWALVVNRFTKSLRYHLEQNNLCPELVGCVEVQEKRLLSTNGIPPLHLHLLFQGRRPYQHWSIDKGEYQRLWSQACKSVWQLESEFGQSCRAESVKSSGVAYMSKYLSKGGELLSKCNPDLLPTAWYTVSSSLKDRIKRTTSYCRSHLAITLFGQLQDSKILRWARDIYSTKHGDGSQYLVAWVGQIADRKTYWQLKKQIDFCEKAFNEKQKAKYLFSLQ